MLDLRQFILLCMYSNLRRRIEDVDGEVAEQGRYKRLKIDKNPERYRAKLFDKYRCMIMKRARATVLEKPAAATKIAKWWRLYKALNDKIVNNTEGHGKRDFLRKGGENVICPITQEAVKHNDVFKVFIDNGSVVVYTLEDLVNYLSSTGTFQCCLTRQELRLPTIRRLVKKALDRSINGAQELLSTYFRRGLIRRDRIEHDNRILAIEASCASVMTDIMDSSANCDIGAVQASIRIAEFVPEWRNLVNDYIRLDANSCLSMLRSDKERIYRLVDTAHADPYYMLAYVIEQVVQPKIDSCERYVRMYRQREDAGRTGQIPLSTSPIFSRSPSFVSDTTIRRTGPFGAVNNEDGIYSIVADSIINATLGIHGFRVPTIDVFRGDSTSTVPRTRRRRTPSPRLSNDYGPNGFGDN